MKLHEKKISDLELTGKILTELKTNEYSTPTYYTDYVETKYLKQWAIAKVNNCKWNGGTCVPHNRCCCCLGRMNDFEITEDDLK